MLLSKLDFTSFLSYTPKPLTDEQKKSRSWMYDLKGDKLINKDLSTVQYFINILSSNLQKFPGIFGPGVHLIPIPKNSLMHPGTLWVPKNLVRAMAARVLGKELDCLIRNEPLQKSATSSP